MNTEEALLSHPLTQEIYLAVALLLLPFVAFLVLIFNRKIAPGTGAVIANLLSFSGFAIALWLFFQVWTKDVQHFQVEWFKLWYTNHFLSFSVGILLDNIAVLLLLVVTLVSFFVHLFSVEYMKEDPGYVRYFAFLGLFTFAMIGIILADNLLLLFVFWELVGLSSYLLIGFWFQKEAAVRAGKKAFLVNRVGDLGFLIAIMILWSKFETLDLQNLKLLAANLPQEQLAWISYHTFHLFGAIHSFSVNWLTIAGIGLFCGAVAKSAQFPLQVWLPDAMEGPTPVSALIHAATMVAAGVFLLARVFGLLNMEALTFIAFIGVVTAFMGAFAAFAQNDIKKVLAFSTISQLGYMVMGVGIGSQNAALFHLLTHAFFKACLFLCAGSIIHALHRLEHHNKKDVIEGFDPQDVRHMGGLRKNLPVTFVAYTIAAAALIGLPLFSGFLSKDALLTGAWAWAEATSEDTISMAYLIPDLAFLTVLLTAAYMTRQFILVFLGRFRGTVLSVGDKIKESSLLVKIPLVLLAICSLGIIFSANPFSNSTAWILQGLSGQEAISMQYIDNNVYEMQKVILGKSEGLHFVIALVSIVMALLGILIGWSLYSFQKRTLPMTPAIFHPNNALYKLSANNFYLDKLYYKIFEVGTLYISSKAHVLDRKVIDGAVNFFGKFNVVLARIVGWIDKILVDGAVKLTVFITGRLGKMTKSIQGGQIQSYFMWSMVGLIVIFLLVLW